ncbi:bifunctional DNA primase/polymerase [Streptomyces sp. GbtcB6]|uniref:bifunctional DNA primase/polymerase n=1 Tax=Streptomyces sp. GbtcB6 TaxID=2824751 RepID=UPI001C2FFAAB|nr:bifunctional DNA primase/polymerase [Streptomyces sp. GbtcB6]
MVPIEDTRRVLENALALATAGHPILPCYTVDKDGRCTCHGKDRKTGEDCRSGKHPHGALAPNGLDDATTDPDVITGWFHARSGRLNFGWRLDGLGVPDVDTYGDKKGAETAERLQAEHGELSHTLTIRTGRGGLQYVYRLPEGVDTEQYADELGEHVDFKRGAGHYVIVPGSKTVDVYRVESGAAIAPLDSWVNDLAIKRGGRKTSDRPRVKPGAVAIPSEFKEGAPWYVNGMVKPDATNRGNNASQSVTGGLSAFLFQVYDTCGGRFTLDHLYQIGAAIAVSYERASDHPQTDELVLDQFARNWARDLAKREEPQDAPIDFSEATGWLMDRTEGFGYNTLTIDFKGRAQTTLFSDFKIQATSVHTADGKTVWTVDLTRSDGWVFKDVELPSDVLNSSAALRPCPTW